MAVESGFEANIPTRLAFSAKQRHLMQGNAKRNALGRNHCTKGLAHRIALHPNANLLNIKPGDLKKPLRSGIYQVVQVKRRTIKYRKEKSEVAVAQGFLLASLRIKALD